MENISLIRDEYVSEGIINFKNYSKKMLGITNEIPYNIVNRLEEEYDKVLEERLFKYTNLDFEARVVDEDIEGFIKENCYKEESFYQEKDREKVVLRAYKGISLPVDVLRLMSWGNLSMIEYDGENIYASSDEYCILLHYFEGEVVIEVYGDIKTYAKSLDNIKNSIKRKYKSKNYMFV